MPGEVFDITCFTGINQYHALRTEGLCNPAHLSSAHIRAVDFELMCAPPDQDATSRKEAFTRSTHSHFVEAITYLASINLAYENEPNHDSISASSFANLQCTREDLSRLGSTMVDPHADIVTLVIDAVTDKKHLHFVKASSTPSSTYRKQVAQLAQLAQQLS